MASPAQDINYWITICVKLSASESFALLGAIAEGRYISLNINNPRALVTDDNCNSAQKWASDRVRKLIRLYCKQYNTFHVLALGELLKAFAPLVQIEMNILIGPAVLFIAWATGQGLDKWCQKYATKELEGKGSYIIERLGFESGAFFKLKYSPPIIELVTFDESYSLDVKQRRVVSAAETNGLIEFPEISSAQTVVRTFSSRVENHFSFTDTKTLLSISGKPTNILTERFQSENVVGLTAGDLEFNTDRL